MCVCEREGGRITISLSFSLMCIVCGEYLDVVSGDALRRQLCLLRERERERGGGG